MIYYYYSLLSHQQIPSNPPNQPGKHTSPQPTRQAYLPPTNQASIAHGRALGSVEAAETGAELNRGRALANCGLSIWACLGELFVVYTSSGGGGLYVYYY